MSIGFILRNLFIYLFSILSVIILALTIKIIFNELFFVVAYWVDLIILVISIFSFSVFKRYYIGLDNKLFISHRYNGNKLISSLGDKFRTILGSDRIYKTVSATLLNTFNARSIALLTYKTKDNKYIVQDSDGLYLGKQQKIELKPLDKKIFFQKSEPIIIKKLKGKKQKGSNLVSLFIKLKIEIVVPLNIKNKEVGLIILGSKESGGAYNDTDRSVLKIIGSQTAIALENALLYEEQKRFNVKLKEEVDKATANLRLANAQLRKLDEAKSEFISIASHQLRTPLTAIKGYLSMVLDGDFGKLNKKIADPIGKVFESSERLIKLIENLLSISRIESGRMKYEFKPMDLNNMVSSVVEELFYTFDQRKLKLIYNKPSKQLALVNIDGEKIRQVIVNLIDNAIKYTKKGSVKVSLSLDDDNIKFCVEDTGMGIRKDDLPNLFQKFSRGTGTFLVHTEGVGLGLYVAKKMMEKHNGKIWAESEGEGKGAKFCFLLPIVR